MAWALGVQKNASQPAPTVRVFTSLVQRLCKNAEASLPATSILPRVERSKTAALSQALRYSCSSAMMNGLQDFRSLKASEVYFLSTAMVLWASGKTTQDLAVLISR